jgi:4-amino-4-deoxy-L-arabinose transferase-like glycosyltransferase
MRMSRLSRSARYLIGIAGCALLVYTIYNFVHLPPHRTMPDENRFINTAIELAESGEFWVRGKRAWEMPGLAILYSLLYKTVGSKVGLIAVARTLQSLVLIFTAVLLYGMSRHLFHDRTTATVTYAITLFYPFFIFYQGILMSETLFIFFLVAGFFWLYRWESGSFEKDRYLVGATIAFALAVYVKATLWFLPPLLAGSFALFAGRSRLRAFRALLLSTVVFGLCLSPWWFRNYLIFNEFVPLTTASPRHMYAGNNPMNESGGGRRGTDWEPIAAFETLPELEWSEAYRRETLSYIRENPGKFLRMSVIRFGRYWRIYAYAEEYRTPLYVALSVLSYGVVLIFAIVGMVQNRHLWRRLSPVYVLIVFFTAVHVVVVTSVRYRLPLEPFLILLASPPIAAGVRSALGGLRGGKRSLIQ